MADDFMTMREALAYLGVSRATLDSYVRQGRITRYKSGAPIRTMFRRRQIEALKEIKQVKSKPKDK